MACSTEWYRGYLIAPAFMGYAYEHPAFDPENASDRRMGHGNTVQECRDEIDASLEGAKLPDACKMTAFHTGYPGKGF